MASVNTNAAAITALRTLQQTNTSLDATQKRISTGYKIGEAKDNAAYWSISTTLKSDNKALSTVKDALGLGAATIDTAYQGLNKVKEVLDSIKSKLVAASQDGVDKAAVQGEIAELQKQLKSIATSSTFSGENWLSVDSSGSFNASKTVVAAFNRDKTGSVSLDTIAINTAGFVLIDANTAQEGILDGGKVGNTSLAGLGTNTGSAVTAEKANVEIPSGSFVAATGSMTGKIVVNGIDYTFTMATTSSTTKDDVENYLLANATDTNGHLLNTVAESDGVTGNIKFRTLVTGSAQTMSATITGVAASGIALGTTAGTAGVDGGYKTVSNAVAAPITLDKNDTIDMTVTLDGVAKKFSVTRAAVDAALGTGVNGVIGHANAYASVINKAMEQANITGITASGNGTGSGAVVTLTAKGVAAMTTTATASQGQSILTLDVTNANRSVILNYISAVSAATASVTSAAATLGAVNTRIDLQKTFVDTLMDTIDKGVGNLIDADMSEESTKLQALQVKQQLGVQALSIANQSAQNILSLFRS